MTSRDQNPNPFAPPTEGSARPKKEVTSRRLFWFVNLTLVGFLGGVVLLDVLYILYLHFQTERLLEGRRYVSYDPEWEVTSIFHSLGILLILSFAVPNLAVLIFSVWSKIQRRKQPDRK